MSVLNRNKNGQDTSHGENSGHGPRPYWKRAHRDWRIWFGVILMLLAMLVYLMTGDFRWPLQGHPQPLVPIVR